MEIINFVKVWWHCLLRMLKGHRIVSTVLLNPAEPLDWTYMRTKWSCSVCGDIKTWK